MRPLPWLTLRTPAGPVPARLLFALGPAHAMVAAEGRWVAVRAEDLEGPVDPPAWALDGASEPRGTPDIASPTALVPVHDAYTGARLDLAFPVEPGDVVAVTDAERAGTTLIHVEHVDRFTVVGHRMGGRQIIVPASLVLRPATIAEAAAERPAPALSAPTRVVIAAKPPVTPAPKPQPRRSEPARPTGQLSLF